MTVFLSTFSRGSCQAEPDELEALPDAALATEPIAG